MTCLTAEQLVGLAIGQADDPQLAAHAKQCEACRTKLAELSRLTHQLSGAHAELTRNHAASRARLLASLPNLESLPAPHLGAWAWFTRQLEVLTVRQRIAVGGIGVTTLAAIGLLLVAMNSAGQLSAMERMANELRAVTSYSYKMFSQDTFVQKGEAHPRTVAHSATTFWLEPDSLFYEEKLERFEGPVPLGDGEGKLLAHLTGIHPTGQPGMLIYHAGTHGMNKTYWWVPEVRSDEVGDESPITRLRMVREGAGEVLRELGTKMIDGKISRGYVMALKNAKLGSGFDAIEVWVDPETDLPLEFGYELKTDEATHVFRITDCRWNIEIDPNLFDTTLPVGYDDITPPTNEKAISEIIVALQLYAQLSGGQYPHVTQFHSDAVRDEMLNLAGYMGPSQAEWNRDETFQQIQQAAIGLDWIERILRHHVNAGYYGTGVSDQDNDKILLWWTTDALTSYRVFYGDLRTEILPLAEWAKLVPAEVAVHHQDDDE